MLCLLNVNVLLAVELKVTKFKSCISGGRCSNIAKSLLLYSENCSDFTYTNDDNKHISHFFYVLYFNMS